MNLENDDDNESEDDSLNPTPSPTNQTEDGGDELPGRSTSEPLKKELHPKGNRPKKNII